MLKMGRFLILIFVSICGLSSHFFAQQSGARPLTPKMANLDVAKMSPKVKSKESTAFSFDQNFLNQIKSPEVTEAYKLLGAGKIGDAIAEFQKYKEENWFAAYGLACAFDQPGFRDIAISTLNASLSKNPGNAFMLYKLGELYFNEKDYSNSEKQFITLVNLDNSRSNVWYELGFLYMMHEDLQNFAEFCFTKVQMLDPKNANAPIELARIHSLEGNIKTSLRDLEQAFNNGFTNETFIEQDPDLMNVKSVPEFNQLMKKYFQK